MNIDKDFFIQSTLPTLGVVDMAAQPANLSIVGQEYFFIAVEVPNPIVVNLADGTRFTITTVMATAYKGVFMPIAIKTVIKAGTTGTFSIGF